MYPLYNASERVIGYYDDEEVKIQSPWRWSTLELYTARYTVYTAKRARNGPIQLTRSVPGPVGYTARPYTATLYSIQRIHYTALYADPLRPHTPTLQRTRRRDATARARGRRGAGQPSPSYACSVSAAPTKFARRNGRGATAAIDSNVLRRVDHDLETGREIGLQVQNGARAVLAASWQQWRKGAQDVVRA